MTLRYPILTETARGKGPLSDTSSDEKAMQAALDKIMAGNIRRGMTKTDTRDQTRSDRLATLKKRIRDADKAPDQEAAPVEQELDQEAAESRHKAAALAENYYASRSEYYSEDKGNGRTPSYRHRKTLSEKGHEQQDNLWLDTVLPRCIEAGVTPERFIKAQFDYFSKEFGRAAETGDLGTPDAARRAKEYKGTTKGTVAGVIKIKSDLSARFEWAEKFIQSACKAHGIGRADYYRMFVLTGLVPVHPEFLRADPVYQQVLKEPGAQGLLIQGKAKQQAQALKQASQLEARRSKRRQEKLAKEKRQSELDYMYRGTDLCA